MGIFRLRKKEIEDTTDQVVGGFAFYLSLLLLLPTGLLLLGTALQQVWHADFVSSAVFLISISLGTLCAHYGIRGHMSVLLHEWKHQIVSSLVGNKNKRMEIKESSGSLQYEYTKATAHYNAFISLAPYILPVFTFLAVLISLATGASHPLVPLVIIGFAYGIDLLTNARDISPIQTDISLIRGGYAIGLLYIISWNMLIAALAFSWAINGLAGISQLLETILRIFISIYSAITGWHPEVPSSVPEI